MSNVYRLWPDTLSNDVTQCLAQLHAEARRGRVKGIAFVAYVDDDAFIANAAGEAMRDPTNTRGMLLALDGKLAAHVTGQHL